MTRAARERARVRTPIWVASGLAWLAIVLDPGGATLHDHHMHHGSLRMVVDHNASAGVAIGWLLMLVAMMLPLVTPAIRHVRDRSFARRRHRATAQFLAGYLLVWMLAGAVLMFAALVVRSSVRSEWAPVVVGVAAVLMWQLCPLKQICVNRMHAQPPLAAFGIAADLDAVRFGVVHGAWCVGSCWLLMLLPMLFASGHLAVMVLVTLWMWAEQLEPPIAPRWRLRVPARAMRALAYQARLRAG
jgi:predicted metal-binding membrane protein